MKERVGNSYTSPIPEQAVEHRLDQVDQVAWQEFKQIVIPNLGKTALSYKELILLSKRQGDKKAIQELVRTHFQSAAWRYGMEEFRDDYDVLSQNNCQFKDEEWVNIAQELLKQNPNGEIMQVVTGGISKKALAYDMLRYFGALAPPYEPLVKLVAQIREKGKIGTVASYDGNSLYSFLKGNVYYGSDISRKTALLCWANQTNGENMVAEAGLALAESALKSYELFYRVSKDDPERFKKSFRFKTKESIQGEEDRERSIYYFLIDSVPIFNEGVQFLDHYGEAQVADDFLSLLAENREIWQSFCHDKYHLQVLTKDSRISLQDPKIDFYHTTRVALKGNDPLKFKQIFYDSLSTCPDFQKEILKMIVIAEEDLFLPHYADIFLGIAGEALEKNLLSPDEFLAFIQQYGDFASKGTWKFLLDSADNLLRTNNIALAFKIYDVCSTESSYDRASRIGREIASTSVFNLNQAISILEQARDIIGLQMVEHTYWNVGDNRNAAAVREKIRAIQESGTQAPLKLTQQARSKKLIEEAENLLIVASKQGLKAVGMNSVSDLYEKYLRMRQRAEALKMKEE